MEILDVVFFTVVIVAILTAFISVMLDFEVPETVLLFTITTTLTLAIVTANFSAFQEDKQEIPQYTEAQVQAARDKLAKANLEKEEEEDFYEDEDEEDAEDDAVYYTEKYDNLDLEF